MPVDLELAPKQKRPAGEPCCEPVVYPDIERREAERMATVAKALGDPIRLQLVDVLRRHAGKVCVCELVPLFDLSQPTVSHHLKVLREAGIVGSERRGLWAYYYVHPEAVGGALRMAVQLTKRDQNWRESVLEAKDPPERVPRIYTRLAPVYEAWARATESKARRRVLELASLRPGEDVLEVATGTGVQLVRLATANPGGRTVGVEISEGMLAQRAGASSRPGSPAASR